MGSTINPRARGGASLSGELRASRDDRQQIRRLFTATPKQKPADTPAPVAGGSVSRATYVDCYDYRLESFTGGTRLVPTPDGWMTDVLGRTVHDEPEIVIDSGRGLAPAVAGLYMCRVRVSVEWNSGAADPTGGGVNVNVGSGGASGIGMPLTMVPALGAAFTPYTTGGFADFMWQPIELPSAAEIPGNFDVTLTYNSSAPVSRLAQFRVFFTRCG